LLTLAEDIYKDFKINWILSNIHCIHSVHKMTEYIITTHCTV